MFKLIYLRKTQELTYKLALSEFCRVQNLKRKESYL